MTLATLCFVSAALAGQVPPDDPAGELARARAALESGRPSQAERVFRSLVEAHPLWVEPHLGLARALAAQGRPMEAAGSLLAIGESLLDSNETGQAREVLEQALAFFPGSARGHRDLGVALLREEAFDEARRHLERALELGDTGLAVRLYLGAALWEMGNVAEAEKICREAVRLSDEDPVALHQLGGLLLWQGRYREAVPLLSRAAEKRPAAADILLDLGRAHEGAGEPEKALEIYGRVIELAPEMAKAHYHRGVLLSRAGRSGEAEQALSTFRRLQDEEQDRQSRQRHQQARLNQGWEWLRKGEISRAIGLFRELPETASSLEGLAACYAVQGNHQEAVRALERAVVLAPQRRNLELALARERTALQESSR